MESDAADACMDESRFSPASNKRAPHQPNVVNQDKIAFDSSASSSAMASASSAPPSSSASLATLPTVSYHAMQRAQKTIEDFCRSYLFIFHAQTEHKKVNSSDDTTNVNPPSPSNIIDPLRPSAATLQLMFRVLPLLTWVSGTIYQLDEENEAMNERERDEWEHEPSTDGPTQGESGDKDRATTDVSSSSSLDSEEDDGCTSASSSPTYRALLSVLESEGLLTPGVLRELRCGLEYWRLERKLCRALVQQSQANGTSSPASPLPLLSITEIHIASSCKSFDYRVLHHVLYAFRRIDPDPPIVDALKINELLVDLHDDLVDYEDDVLKNSFNLYRMYIALHGPTRAQELILARVQRLEQQFQQALSRLPSTMVNAFRCREQQAMDQPVGAEDVPAASARKWILPEPIVDEVAYRSEVKRAEREHMELRAT